MSWGGLGFRDDCKFLFKQLNILTVPCEYILESVLYANSNKFRFQVQAGVHEYETRGRHNLRPQFCRLNVSQRGPEFSSQQLFNRLPLNARNLSNAALKKRLKPFLIHNAFYSIQDFLDVECVI